ncbi:PepSY domain-containing protein [Thiobacillus thioparus]|uniref:PepSY domain-containing protein n=1 Tax=Thiobacillus thioparus TaxID=931 RepID=UPI0003716DE1|nr:PepSY domain-containing protein [Thiobacillus thioparus]
MSLRRILYLTHRWLGIAIGAMVLLWFVSGVVMMYVAYPHLDDAERRAALMPLAAEQIKVDAATAWQAVGEPGAPDSVRLVNFASLNAARPGYLFMKTDRPFVVWADNGKLRSEVVAAEAMHAAQAMRGGAVKAINKIDIDQWSLGGLDAHRPLYRIELNDAIGSIVYVSSRTGEVVRDTGRSERAWNWLGSVIHWIYFTPLRMLREPWRQVVMWTSGIAFALALTGASVGWLRIRWRKRYSRNRVTPYRGWQRWHHFLGLGAALFSLTWLFSGWLSVNPFHLFDRGGITHADRMAISGGELGRTELSLAPATLLARQSKPIVEIEWLRFSGQGYLRLYRQGSERSILVSAADFSSTTFSRERLLAAAKRLRPNLPVIGSTWISEGDFYYYRHHDDDPVLPVLRVDFDDTDDTSFYLDPASGRIAGYADNNSRLYRWLFNGLHRLDFPFLTRHRPVWDIVAIALCLFGAMLSFSGVVLGWRRIRK